MDEIFDFSLLDEHDGNEVSQSQSKAELSTGSEINAIENFRCPPALPYFKESDASTQEALETLSDTSYTKYLKKYEAFKQWQKSKELNSFDESVLLEYFRELSIKYKPSSLTTIYTMLKTTILSNCKVDISEYYRLTAFLKDKADGFQSKKLKVFTAEDVKKFLAEAPDDDYLGMKAVLVFGVIVGCSGNVITNAKADYVKDSGDEIIVRIPDPKTNVPQPYMIDGQFAEIVRKYMKIRPTTVTTDRFFIQYRDGKFVGNQPMGRNNVAKIPKKIAKFLKLPEFQAYSVNSFRITSATISDNTGVGIEARHGQWKSSNLVKEEIDLPSTSNVNIGSHENPSKMTATATIASFDESSTDISDDNSLSENEVETFSGAPALPYFKESDGSTKEVLESLSGSSYSAYLNKYEEFKKWQESKELSSFDEPALLEYFRELSTKYKPSSLSTLYSMLKSTILSKHKINISEYRRLLDFLKNNADGFQSKKLKIFTAEDVNKFLAEAPDVHYLVMKTVLVFGVIEASRGDKIIDVKTDYVTDNGDEIIVRIPVTKNKIPKAYVIDGQFAEIVRKYMKLRPIHTSTDRFFIHYRNGKCTTQVMGRNQVAKIPKEIAKFLKLPESEDYTPYSIRNTATTISTNAGVGIEGRHGQWKSSKLAEENVQESLGHKRKIGTSTSNVIIASHENASETIATATIRSCKSSSPANEEVIDESFTDILDSNSLSEMEDENFRCPPALPYFKESDASMQEALETLSDTSYTKYLKKYEEFKNWQKSKELNSFDEPVLLEYFRELSAKYKPTSMSTSYAMLKTMILSNHKINISEYSRLIEFLQNNSEGFQAKKAKLFTTEDVKKFLVEASDDKYLAMKTVLAFAVVSECSVELITKIKANHVKDTGDEIIVRIPDAKTKVAKAYVIDGQFAEIARKYMKVRLITATTDRFFVQYRDGKCVVNQPIGRNNVAKIPKKLPESETYNINSFRITSASISVSTGVGIEARHGRWKSSKLAKENVQKSVGHKRKIATLIAEEIDLPSTSNVSIASHENPSKRTATATIASSDLSSNVNEEINDESSTGISDDNSLSENEVENFRCLPALPYFKESDRSTNEVLESLSDSSYSKYLNKYEEFKKWQESKEFNSFDEPALLKYFRELSTTYKPSSLWSLYSMLKGMILSKRKIDISEYRRLLNFLKNNADGFQSKKFKVFTAEDVNKFLVEAPDVDYLVMKTVLVFGVIGASRGDKIIDVKADYVTDNGDEIIVRIPVAESKVAKTYVIDGQFAEIVRRYMKLRPIHTSTDRFFIHYRNGECTTQVMGRNNVAKIPKQIAKFLKLPESESYSAHSFRNTETTISANAGVGIEGIHGQWKSSKLAEGHKTYIATLDAEEKYSPSTSNTIIASYENLSKRTPTATIASSDLSSFVKKEIIDESSTDISDHNPLSENEVDNFRCPPAASYFKKSDRSMHEALNETLSDSAYKSYVSAYEAFIKWQESNHVDSLTEPVLLDYFRELSTKYKPSSLLLIHSMLKSTLQCNHKVNISEYSRLLDFLKKNADGFQSKKLKVFSAYDINRFLVEAPDDKYLAMKTVSVFGVVGAIRGNKILNVKTDYVKDKGDEIIVRIPDAKTKVAKAFVFDGKFAEIVRKYMKLRPRAAITDRFFIHYRDGRCSNQAMGKDKIAKIPKEVANFLKLPESQAYTGYSFRNTPTTTSTDTSVGIETPPGQWKSTKLSEENVRESLEPKGNIGTFIAEEINSPSTSNDSIPSHEDAPERIVTVTYPESWSIKQEIEDPLSLPEKVATDMSDSSSSSESEEHSDSNDDTELKKHHRIKVENFRCLPPLFSFPKSNQKVRREAPISRGCITPKALEDLSENTYKSYVNAYEAFRTWQESKEVNSFAEPVLLGYFRGLSTKYKPKSLRNCYAMLKSTILSNHNIDISEYSRLSAFLKEQSCGYQRKKSKVFTAEDVNKFLVEAPDFKYLAVKTVLVFGLIGASRGDKIPNVKIDYITDNGNEIVVRIPDQETKVPYIIDGEFAEVVRKYMKLRPITAKTDRFFIQYRDGICTNKVISRRVVLRMPKEMAKFLKLPESEAYTGYSFRSTSRTISADTSARIDTQHRQWRLAKENFQESLGYKGETATFDESTTDMSDNNSSSENEAPKRKREK